MSIAELFDPMRRAIQNIVSRAIVRLVNDEEKLQTMQIEALKNEVRNGLERFQSYGFTSVPKPGAEAVVLFPGGQRDHGLIIAVDDRRYRLVGLQAGEVALYTDEGDYVKLARGNIVEIKAGTKIRFDTPLAEFTGQIHATDTVTSDADVIADGISGKTHIHSGVQTGAGNTGAPVG